MTAFPVEAPSSGLPAPRQYVGFARLDGRPVGIVANQSSVLASVLDIKASRGPAGAVNILYRRDLVAAEQTGDADAVRRAHVDAFCQKFANPYVAAERVFVDEVIEPSGTRAKLISGFRLLAHKRYDNPRRKHGNMPL